MTDEPINLAALRTARAKAKAAPPSPSAMGTLPDAFAHMGRILESLQDVLLYAQSLEMRVAMAERQLADIDKALQIILA